MMRFLLRFLGVTPEAAGKTGKRETAWTLVAIALGLTLLAMKMGAQMVDAMTAVLAIVWPSSIGYVGFAYKLENDKAKILGFGAMHPAGYPADVAPPEGWTPGGDGDVAGAER